MRVLAGGPTRERESEMFRLHVEGLEAQAFLLPEGCGCPRVGGTTSCDHVAPPVNITIRHELVPDDGGPRWHHEKIERVAKVRQRFLEAPWLDPMMECRCDDAPTYDCPLHGSGEASPGPDALLMVDTDVILGPGVLERLWQVDADVVYGVFWTRADWGNAPGIDTWPNVWSHHPYRFDPGVWDALVAPGVNEVEVRGGGACTLIRGRGFESRYWPLLASLSAFSDMMCGEDRSYNLGLEARGIRQVAVTGLPIIHLHDERLQTPEMVAEARERVGLFARVAN